MIRLELPFYATLSLCAGPIVFAHGFRDLRTRRLIQNTPTARIRSMAMGLVEVKGTVLERSMIVAPFSGHECAYWEVDIAVRTRRQAWTTVHRKSSGNPFFVTDGTGVALVYPQGSQCKVPSHCQEEFAGLAVPECYRSYMKEQGLWQRPLWKLSAMRFRERMLEEGQPVFILGTAEPRAPAQEVSSPVEIVTADAAVPWLEPELASTGTDGAPASARTSEPFAHVPARGAGRVKTFHDRISAVIRRGANERTFLISAESETAIETSLALSTMGRMLAGPVLTALGCLYWLLSLSAHRLVR